MIAGPRVGRQSWLRRAAARVLARKLDAFVVPGAELLSAFGLDAARAGLRLVDNPRHASVLLLIGEIPRGLARAAAVAHAQQPRPRVILAVGTLRPAPLPSADVSVEATQTALAAGVADLRRHIAVGAWAPDPPVFEVGAPELPTPDDAVHEARNASVHHKGMDHMSTRHGSGGGMPHEQMSGMDHGQMAGGFMSMATMTRDLPRSADGLPMEWLEVPFGPLFPGLPGGLNLIVTLDGDTVTRAEVRRGVLRREQDHVSLASANALADHLARLNPLTPNAYRILAWQGVEGAAGMVPTNNEAYRRIATLEAERISSHLIWLGRFGFLLGDAWLAGGAAKLACTIRLADDPRRVAELRSTIAAFVARVRRTPLLQQRLGGVGSMDPLHADGMLGPVGRACGQHIDARSDDPTYLQVGFAPTIDYGCDALARLQVRLAEVDRSLALIVAADASGPPVGPSGIDDISGTGEAHIETPRGMASLTATFDHGHVVDLATEVPSSAHLHLVEHVATGRELSDALLGVASLDLSPWELDL